MLQHGSSSSSSSFRVGEKELECSTHKYKNSRPENSKWGLAMRALLHLPYTLSFSIRIFARLAHAHTMLLVLALVEVWCQRSFQWFNLKVTHASRTRFPLSLLLSLTLSLSLSLSLCFILLGCFLHRLRGTKSQTTNWQSFTINLADFIFYKIIFSPFSPQLNQFATLTFFVALM